MSTTTGIDTESADLLIVRDRQISIVRDYPPNYKQICDALPHVRSRKSIIFTYGSVIYNPSGVSLPYHLLMHEVTHMSQQAEVGVDYWWDHYIHERLFRLEMEVQAYQAQYKAMNRAQKRSLLNTIAADLAGPMYGGITDFKTAKRLIRGGE